MARCAEPRDQYSYERCHRLFEKLPKIIAITAYALQGDREVPCGGHGWLHKQACETGRAACGLGILLSALGKSRTKTRILLVNSCGGPVPRKLSFTRTIYR